MSDDTLNGAENDTPVSVIRKHLSAALQGPNWDALIAALAAGDEINWDNARKAFDQLYVSSASGSFLDQRAADEGLKRPLDTGISDDLFRQLVIRINSNKNVQEAIREVLEVFYGAEAVRAYSTSTSGPFDLLNKTLEWSIDEQETFSCTFVAGEAVDVHAVTAEEVAFKLTNVMRQAGSRGYAVPYVEPTTGLSVVHLFSGTLGLRSFVRVTGGTAQPVLQFPALLDPYSGTAIADWTYTHPTATTSQLQVDSNDLNLSIVQPGDYVVIGSDAQSVVGSWKILSVDIVMSGGLMRQTITTEQIPFEGTAGALSNAAYIFFRPTKASTLSGDRSVAVSQSIDRKVNVKIPATSQAVTRTVQTGAYLAPIEQFDIISTVRIGSQIEVTTATDHGRVVGQQVFLDELSPVEAIPTTSAGNGVVYGSGAFTYNASNVDIVAPTQEWPATSRATSDGVAIKLTNGSILFNGGWSYVAAVKTASNLSTLYTSGAETTVTSGAIDVIGATRHSHSWDIQDSMAAARWSHAGSTNGPWAVVSGGRDGSTILTSTEQYWTDGTWNALPDLNIGRAAHKQVELANGLVLAVGGATTVNDATGSSETFNGLTWDSTGTMATARAHHTLLAIDSSAYAIGGQKMAHGAPLEPETLALWRFDDTGGTAADETGDYPLTYGTGTVASGKIGRCMSGKASGAGDTAAVNAMDGGFTAELWFKAPVEPFSGSIISYASDATHYEDALMLAYVDGAGDLLVGWGTGSLTTDTTNCGPVNALHGYVDGGWNHLAFTKEIFSITFSGLTSSLSVGMALVGKVSGARAVVTGGDLGPSSTGTVEVRQVGKTTFVTGEAVAVQALEGRTQHSLLDTRFTADALRMTRMVYFNGALAIASPDRANSIGGTGGAWSIGGDLINGDLSGYVDDTRVSNYAKNAEEIQATYWAGVATLDSLSGDRTATCEKYNAGSWTSIAKMNEARSHHQSVLLPDGRILVSGGIGQDGTSLTSAEVYNPSTGCWTLVGSMAVDRYEHLMVVDGQEVVVMGGLSTASSDTSPVEILDLNTMQWRNSPALIPTPRPMVGALSSELVAMGGDNGSAVREAIAYIKASHSVSNGHMSQMFAVTSVPSSTQLMLESTADDFTYATGGILTGATAIAATSPGPTLLAPDADYSFSAVEVELVTALTEGVPVSELTVTGTVLESDFAVVLGFGTSRQTDPLKVAGTYVPTTGQTTLVLDRPFNPEQDYSAGEGVTITVSSTPAGSFNVGSFWLTSSASGRTAAQSLIQSIAAAGVEVDVEVVYPGDTGLGGAGYPTTGDGKKSDVVTVFADRLDQ